MLSLDEDVKKRVPELTPSDVFKKADGKEDNTEHVSPQELAEYNAIIFGTPTRFGNMSSQMHNFLDQTGGLWVKGALIGKIGSVFVSTVQVVVMKVLFYPFIIP